MTSLLKSLELHGYKTFASRTLFEFAGSITAIVGPNGSGKSNVADALRWVLGEQSYSLLRGKKTEDMIFSGSEQRPRSGMASATIVFDNAGGWLPIDFSEVAITRRAYRDGDNEYLLNGQRVRLRDVSELLSQSGLAERTYTIIGQGLVDSALSLKAEERRRLFEEAAGIGLHRSRREEALRRLETTRRNLDRVQDILVELQPRLRSLERQARRSKEYEQVKADLQVVLREWYGYHWRRLQQELAEAMENGRVKERLLENARGEQAAKEQVLFEVRERIRKLRETLSEQQRQLTGLHSQRETVSRELAVGEERSYSLEEQCKNSQAELARLEEDSGLQTAKIENAQEELNRLEAELEEARAQTGFVRESLKSRQAERERVEKKVLAARQAVGSLTGKEAHLRSRLSDRQAQSSKQRQVFLDIEKSLTLNEEEQKKAQAVMLNTQSEMERIQKERRSLEGRLEKLKDEAAQEEASRKVLLEKKAAAEAQAARLKAQLEILVQAETNLAGYAKGARLLIEAARKDRLSGAKGALGSQIDVPAELEAAVAAVLGDFVDAIVLEGTQASEDALNLLEGQDARAALLPLETLLRDLQEPDLTSEAGREGVIGLASHLVAAPQHLTPAIKLLLGQVIIVKDRAAARKALRGKRDGVRAVTLKGEVFYASGLIQVGSESKPGVLSRPREIREMQEHLNGVEARLNQNVVDLGEMDSNLQELKNLADDLERHIRQVRQQEENARREQGKAELNVEKVRRQVVWQREQKTRLEGELASFQDEINHILADLAPLEGEILRARQTLREEIGVLNGLSLEELQTELAHWNTRTAVAERSMQQAKNQLVERQASLERANRVREGLLQRLAELEAASEKIKSTRHLMLEKGEEISPAVEALRVSIHPIEAELAEAEKEQLEFQQQEAAARQALSSADHHHAQSKILLVRCQESLDSMRRRVEDDFGLVQFEYAEEISGPTPLPLDGMVEQLPVVVSLSPEVEETIRRQRGQLRRMGPINPEAQVEYEEVKERFQFLNEQVADLNQAELDVKAVIAELDLLMEREFRKTFDAVSHEFRSIFTRLFGGGSARLILTDPDDLTSTGIDIEARLPGRRTQGLSLLSGGERSLTATALVFSLLKVSPTPFCVLDEVDAMLDEANVGRFRELLRELSQDTQFVIVTHNRNTVQAADVIYGVTMGKDSASQVISLKLDEAVSEVS
jgi:chromosome segregation protein